MSPPGRSVVIHGHFYQPPREDPWLEEVERQPSAAPHHDWNRRIEEECYRAVLAARIPGPTGRIRTIVNTLLHLSFNVGPTLLEWLEEEAPGTYQAILGSDRRSRELHDGHGNALAQPFHHTILPLASRREKVTEVRWGIADFRRRFGRDPAGMWLPETAVDAETLDVLAQEGIAFTVVAPHQVHGSPADGGPGLYRTPGGRTLTLFPYHGPLSHGVAFGSLLRDAGRWAEAMASARWSPGPEETGIRTGAEETAPPLFDEGSPARLVSIATDGETYGHHHSFGEMALAAVVEKLRARPGVRVENFASYLARNPPTTEVTLNEPTSWSCVHGVERWRGPCGCAMEPRAGTTQEWRAGLRRAMEWLSEALHRVYEEEAVNLLRSPWKARDAYGEVVGAGPDAPRRFVEEWASRPLDTEERIRATELLELERNALRLFTSCAWFFDDLARIEPLQVLAYAARALELADDRERELEKGFLERLAGAETNEDPARDGRTLYLDEVKPRVQAHLAVAAGAAACAAAGVGGRPPRGYRVERPSEGDASEDRPPDETSGRLLRLRVEHRRTGRVWEVEARTEGSGATRPAVAVRDGDGTRGPSGFSPVPLADLPESYRLPLEEELEWSAVEREASPEILERMRRGAMTREEAVSVCLEKALEELETPDPSPDTLRRVKELAELHTLAGRPIPFAVQSRFWSLLEEASPEPASTLSILREPLGFVTDP